MEGGGCGYPGIPSNDDDDDDPEEVLRMDSSMEAAKAGVALGGGAEEVAVLTRKEDVEPLAPLPAPPPSPKTFARRSAKSRATSPSLSALLCPLAGSKWLCSVEGGRGADRCTAAAVIAGSRVVAVIREWASLPAGSPPGPFTSPQDSTVLCPSSLPGAAATSSPSTEF